MFEIRELRHLLSIDEFRHFGQAAKAVGLTQPALTKSLQRMEKALGAQIFERSRARVIPTTVGKEVLARARRLVDDAEELQRAVDAMTGAEAASATIGVGPAMSETYVAAAIAEVAQSRPRAQISVRVESWRQLTEWLLVGELDFYVADVGDARIDGRFTYTSLPSHSLVWFCRREHPLARRKKKPVTRRDMLQYPIATPKMPPWATEWFAAESRDPATEGLPRPLPAIECESFAMLKRIVESSDCLSAALQPTLADEIKAGSLVILQVDAPLLTTHAGVIRMKDRTLSPVAAELVARIEAAAKSASNEGRAGR